MKRLFNTIAGLFLTLTISLSLNAQTITEEVDLIQSIYGMEKKSVISEFLGDSVGDTFWEVYDAYELERKQLGKDRIQLLSDYADNYTELKGEKADAMVKNAESLNKSQNKLISKYTKQVRKVAGSEVAAQFYQIEHYLLSATRTEIFENIPFIGDMRKN
jgi:hypothetical protein